MLTNTELDQRRADFMDVVYERAGRTDGTYTGLWDEFSREVASNLRDLDYSVLRSDLIRAVGGTLYLVGFVIFIYNILKTMSARPVEERELQNASPMAA